MIEAPLTTGPFVRSSQFASMRASRTAYVVLPSLRRAGTRGRGRDHVNAYGVTVPRGAARSFGGDCPVSAHFDYERKHE